MAVYPLCFTRADLYVRNRGPFFLIRQCYWDFINNTWVSSLATYSLVRPVLSLFFRGVPALVLLFLLYFGLPYQLSAVTASIICFTITSSAFLGEIYRGSLAGVPQGQWDAGLAGGFSFLGVLRYIVLPQAFRISIPALSNVAMDLVKGTSLAATITVPEIFQKAKIIGGRTFDYFSLYILVALVYWLICIGIEKVQQLLEKHYANRLIQ